MADEVKYDFALMFYEGRDTADQVYETLRGLEKQRKVNIRTAAVLTRKENGKIRLNHKRRVTVWKGAVGGGVIGLLAAALLSGPVGAVTLGGAVVGGVIGMTRSRQRRQLKNWVDEKLGQNQSGLAVLINYSDWPAVIDATEAFGGEAALLELTPGSEKQLEALMEDEEVAKQVGEEVEVVEE
jgi:uncharacterized membrane protein